MTRSDLFCLSKKSSPSLFIGMMGLTDWWSRWSLEHWDCGFESRSERGCLIAFVCSRGLLQATRCTDPWSSRTSKYVWHSCFQTFFRIGREQLENKGVSFLVLLCFQKVTRSLRWPSSEKRTVVLLILLVNVVWLGHKALPSGSFVN